MIVDEIWIPYYPIRDPTDEDEIEQAKKYYLYMSDILERLQ